MQLRIRNAAFWIVLALAAQSLTGCASIAAYQVGRRTCKAESTPHLTDFHADNESLYVSYDCHLSKRDRIGLGGDSAGIGSAVARVRLGDLFGFPYGATPMELTPGGFNFHKRVPLDPDEAQTQKTCLFVTGGSPTFTLHLNCGDPKKSTTLDILYPQLRKGFEYRTAWGYGLMPILMPLAFAVDVAASPFYALIYLTLPNHMSDRRLEERTRSARTIAYDWGDADQRGESFAVQSR